MAVKSGTNMLQPAKKKLFTNLTTCIRGRGTHRLDIEKQNVLPDTTNRRVSRCKPSVARASPRFHEHVQHNTTDPRVAPWIVSVPHRGAKSAAARPGQPSPSFSQQNVCVWLHRSRLHCLKFATFLPDRLLFCAYRSTNLSSQHVGHRRGESVAGEVACTTAKKTLGISRELLAGLIAPQQSALWHERLLLAEVDLVSELEAGNLFCINVESMIFDISESKEVAFEDDAQILRFAAEHQGVWEVSSGRFFRRHAQVQQCFQRSCELLDIHSCCTVADVAVNWVGKSYLSFIVDVFLLG